MLTDESPRHSFRSRSVPRPPRVSGNQTRIQSRWRRRFVFRADDFTSAPPPRSTSRSCILRVANMPAFRLLFNILTNRRIELWIDIPAVHSGYSKIRSSFSRLPDVFIRTGVAHFGKISGFRAPNLYHATKIPVYNEYKVNIYYIYRLNRSMPLVPQPIRSRVRRSLEIKRECNQDGEGASFRARSTSRANQRPAMCPVLNFATMHF